ncbi:MAG: glycosyltransferase family 4 protein [Phycicoccus sp.]|nr:glycosyltransferase family 4 protein [Phycicoccus sp.]
MKPTVVLAANNGDIGGGEVMLLEIADALTDLGVDVSLVGPAYDGGVLDQGQARGHRVTRLAGDRRTYMAQLRSWDTRHRRGVLWCNGLVPALATAGHRQRVVHLHLAPSGVQRTAARLARAQALMTLVPSETLARALPGARVLWNWSPEFPVHVVPGAQPVVRLGYLGRLTVEKGLPILAAAVQQLSREGVSPPLELVVAGAARFASTHDQRIIEDALSRIDGRVQYTGWIDRSDFFGRIDVAVFPSLVPESFGLVVTEAMSARVPFVISDAGALPEIAGSHYPWVAATGDPAALAHTLGDLLGTSPADRGATVTASRERWERHFSPTAGRARLRRVLDDLNSAATR